MSKFTNISNICICISICIVYSILVISNISILVLVFLRFLSVSIYDLC